MARTAKTINISLMPETLEAITEAAAKDKRSRSSWIAIACEEKLQRDTPEMPSTSEEGEG